MDIDDEQQQSDQQIDESTTGGKRKCRNRVDPNFEQFELFLQELKESGDNSRKQEADAIHRRWFTDEDYYSSLLM